MHNVLFNLYPGGVSRCLTFSYDDGPAEDIRLTDMLRRYGLKGSFHLNSARMTPAAAVSLADIPAVYAGQEVSCHMVNHPFPTDIPDAAVLAQIQEDRRALEKACGYVVRGMSYPFGNYDSRVIGLLRTAGMEYSRTTRATNSFGLPEDFMAWHPTCHHNGHLADRLADFNEPDRWGRSKLFYVWGHSYEFPRDNNWDMMEEFCKAVSGREDVWYAANIEIVDYVNALRSLRISVDCDKFYNPTVTPVWITVDGQKLKVGAGETLVL